MICTPRKVLGALLFSGLIGSYPAAQAATLNLPGATVDFTILNVEELLAVGGTPSVVGDQLKFSFHDFEVWDINLDPPAFKHITLLIDVKAKTPGNALTNPVLNEQGDFIVLDSGAPQTDNLTFSQVFGQLIGDNQVGAGLETDNFSFKQDVTGFGPWSITEGLEDVAGWGSDFIRLTFENNVLATALLGNDLAFIEKKFASISITAVPVPAAVWLLGSAVVPLLLMPRRRKG